MEITFRDNLESLYKNTEYEAATRYGDSFSDNLESLYKNSEYDVVTRYGDHFQ